MPKGGEAGTRYTKLGASKADYRSLGTRARTLLDLRKPRLEPGDRCFLRSCVPRAFMGSPMPTFLADWGKNVWVRFAGNSAIAVLIFSARK